MNKEIEKFDEEFRDIGVAGYLIGDDVLSIENGAIIKTFIDKHFIAKEDVITFDQDSVGNKDFQYISFQINGERVKIYTEEKVLDMIGEDEKIDKRLSHGWSNFFRHGSNQAKQEMRDKLK